MNQAIKNTEIGKLFDNLEREADAAAWRMFKLGIIVGVTLAGATLMVALFVSAALYV